MRIGTLRDGNTVRPALIEDDRVFRLDDILGAMGGVSVTVPDAADAAAALALPELAAASTG